MITCDIFVFLRILIPLELWRASLAGTTCGFFGEEYGEYPSDLTLFTYDNVPSVKLCPEDFAFGTRRQMCNIHGGTCMDVLEGRAKVWTESGLDWTEGMIRASEKMLEKAVQEKIELAVLMDISAACGSQVIYDGPLLSKIFRMRNNLY